MAITIESIASEIFSELEEPETLTVSSIGIWLSGNHAKLNSLLFLDIVVADGVFEPEVDSDYAAILKTLYLIHYYRNLKRRVLLLGSSIMSVTEGDTVFRRASKNETAKAYDTIISDLNSDLNNLVISYKINKLGFKGIQLEPL